MCEETQLLDGEEILTSGDGWYWGSSFFARDTTSGRTLHPTSVLWSERGSGKIVDNDNIGGPLQTSPAADWCATAVRGGNLEVWHAELIQGRVAVALLNRSPERETVYAKWQQL